jgi:hypothetical protein
MTECLQLRLTGPMITLVQYRHRHPSHTLSQVTMPCTFRRWSHRRTRSVRGVSGGAAPSRAPWRILGARPCTSFRHRGHASVSSTAWQRKGMKREELSRGEGGCLKTPLRLLSQSQHDAGAAVNRRASALPLVHTNLKTYGSLPLVPLRGTSQWCRQWCQVECNMLPNTTTLQYQGARWGARATP